MILSNEDLFALLDTAYECGELHRGKFYKNMREDNIEDYLTLAKLFVFAIGEEPVEMKCSEPEPEHEPQWTQTSASTELKSDIVWDAPMQTPYDFNYEDEDDVYYCFYHFSKEDCEKAARRLVPHLIEEYPMIFEQPVNIKDITNLLCEDEPFINIFFSNYRSMIIMLYRCFDFVTWESNTEKNMVKIFYRQLNDSETDALRAEGYHIANAIEAYKIFN